MKDIIIAILGSGALSSIIAAVIAAIASRNKGKKALQLLMLDSLKRNGKQFLSDGKISHEELQAYEEAYQCYKALGGNGYAEAIQKKVAALPIEVEE